MARSNVMERTRKNIIYLRELHDMTLREFGEVLNCGESYMSRVEKGTRGLTLEHLEKIAAYFDITPGRILDEDFSAESIFT
jgi:transcriptional regulator with XRE-family HTH domain